MLEGINGVTFGYTYETSHTTIRESTVRRATWRPGPTLGPEVGKVGGHSFRLKITTRIRERRQRVRRMPHRTDHHQPTNGRRL